MKNKILTPVVSALIAALCINACTETFAPNVNFGDKTYLNDYSKLVEQAKNLVEKIDILNTIATDNYEQIVIAIDGVTNAIEAHTSELSSGLQEIVVTLLNGFSSVSTTICKTGERIIYALNDNGDLIALHLDINGTLISAAIEANTAELIEAINDSNAGIADRVEALNVILKTGLAVIKIESDNTAGAELVAKLEEINAALKGINLSLLDGFSTLATTISQTGGSIVYAINGNGEILAAHIDENGQLISAQIKGSVQDLIKTINNATATVADRIDALNTVIVTGLATIKIDTSTLESKIEASIENLSDAVKGLQVTMLNGFGVLSRTVFDSGDSIVKAINAQGDKISLTIDKNGHLISVKIDGLIDTLEDLILALDDVDKTLSEKLIILNDAIEDGFDGLYFSIAAQTNALSLKIGDVESTLFNGFVAIKTQIGESGDEIVNAINDKGELIALHLDTNGILLSATIKCVASDIIKAINDQTLELGERMEALNLAVETGLADITVKIGKTGKKLEAAIVDLNETLAGLKLTMFDGFTQLNATVKETGDKLVYAIDADGQLIALRVQENGELISSAIKCQTKQLVSAINSKGDDLANRLGALNIVLESGLAGVNVTLGNVGGMLDMRLVDINESIKGIKPAIVEGYKILSKVILESGTTVVKAINENGDKVSFSIDEHGKLISAKLDGVINTLEDLVAALEDQTNTLAEKFDLLNKAVGNGADGIVVAIDKQTCKMSLKLGELSSTLLDGFNVIKTAVNAQGVNITYAIDKAGELIALHLDDNGKLLSAVICAQTKDLVAAINSIGGKLEDKLAALTTVVETGLARIEIKIPAIDENISVRIAEVADAVKDMSAAMLDGFKMVSKYTFKTGESIVKAIGEHGEKISLTIDNHGNLISAKLDGVIDTIKDLLAAIEDSDKDLASKFDLLNKAIADGMDGIVFKLNEQTGILNLRLDGMNSTLFAGFEGLKSSLDALGDKVVYAINSNGELIAVTINGNGALLSAAIKAQTDDIVKALKDQTTSLDTRLSYLNLIVDSGLAGIKAAQLEVGDKLDLRLKNINNTLKDLNGNVLEGFTISAKAINDNGEAIVTAIGSNGDKISAIIDAKGNLIALELEGIVDAIDRLIAFLEDQDNSIADRIDALNKAICDGLAAIKAEIAIEGTGIRVTLGEMELSLFNGFKLLTDKMDAQGNTIAAAINAQGEGIILKLDEKGNLINASIELGADAIVNALKDQNKGLDEKLGALNKALADGFLALTADLDAVTGAIKMNYGMLSQIDADLDADLKALIEALEEGLDNIFKGLGAISIKIDDNGDKIVEAITAEGAALILQIDNSGKLIEASLDDNTTALIKALKDQNTSLESKLDALGKLIEDGLGNIKVELGNLYGELKLDLGGLGDIIKEGFEGVTGGLTELKSQMNADGTAIVNAITSKGDLIQGQIDASGKLIEAAIKANTKDIKDALTAQATGAQAIADKVDALNTTVNTGLGNIEAKIDAQTGEIKTGYTDLSGKLGTIGTNILNGFNGVHTDLDALKAAINGLKDQLTIDINANTEAILTLDADFKDQLGKLVAAVEKIGGNIVLAINGQKEAIVLALGPDGSIVGAINAGAVKIVDALDAQTASLTALLNDADGGLPAILKALGTADDDIKDILEYLKSKPDVDLSEIINLLGINNHLLTEILAISDGVFVDSTKLIKSGEGAGKFSQIYITPEVRDAAQNSSETEKALLTLLHAPDMNAPSTNQYVKDGSDQWSTKTVHPHSFWKKAYEDPAKLVGTKVITDTDNKSLIEVEARKTRVVWLVKICAGCSYQFIHGIKVTDALGTQRISYTATYDGNKSHVNVVRHDDKYDIENPVAVIFTCYNDATGAFVQNPDAMIFCTEGGDRDGTITSPTQHVTDNGLWPADLEGYARNWLAEHPDVK